MTQVHALLPADGVYAVGVRYANKRWLGAANIGPNPTFGENVRKVEVYLLDFSGQLVGESISVEFLSHCRPTRRFASADELVSQLRLDVEQVRQLGASYLI